MATKPLPYLSLKLRNEYYYIPIEMAGRGLFQLIPGWLRDSKIDPPEPDESSQKMGFSKSMAIMLRSGIKGLISPWLPRIYLAFYGQKMKVDRSDTMPIIMTLLVNFVVRQVWEHPMEFVVDETTNTVIGVRPCERGDGTIRPTVARSRVPEKETGTEE